MQNKIIRIISFQCLKDHVNMKVLYKSMNILQVNKIYELELAKFMYSYHNKKLPENFHSYFKSASTHHNHITRSITNQNYFLQRMNSSLGQASCNYFGVKIWNSIPFSFKSKPYHSFCKLIKQLLLNKQLPVTAVCHLTILLLTMLLFSILPHTNFYLDMYNYKIGIAHT